MINAQLKLPLAEITAFCQRYPMLREFFFDVYFTIDPES